jgi:hypothetical protein
MKMVSNVFGPRLLVTRLRRGLTLEAKVPEALRDAALSRLAVTEKINATLAIAPIARKA